MTKEKIMSCQYLSEEKRALIICFGHYWGQPVTPKPKDFATGRSKSNHKKMAETMVNAKIAIIED